MIVNLPMEGKTTDILRWTTQFGVTNGYHKQDYHSNQQRVRQWLQEKKIAQELGHDNCLDAVCVAEGSARMQINQCTKNTPYIHLLFALIAYSTKSQKYKFGTHSQVYKPLTLHYNVTTCSQFPFSPNHTNNNHYINAMDSPNYNLTICNNMDVDYMIMQSNKRKNINKSKHTYTGTMVETPNCF